MPKAKKKPTMTWEEAPDTIGVLELMEILGIGIGQASDIFNTKGFPKVPGKTGLKADKEAARLFIQGIRIKENSKSAIDYMILLELKKLNNYFEEMRTRTNE